MLQKFQDQQRVAYQNQKLKQIQAEQSRMDQVAAKEAAAKKAQEEKQKQAVVSQAPTATKAVQSTTSTSNKGTFKLSFYDPAAMGSNMGYGGVAANLSVFPKGTKLKITLSDGTVWYKVVNDTGSFAASNPHQLDVAMPNSQVPAAGILYATVEVIG
ncbi:hydrolase [Lactobacillus sp. PV034]|nr:hydrolase [Lactobacillus sp. PV034]